MELNRLKSNVMEVEKIVILVKLGYGTVRQVHASDELKKIALKMLTAETGSLQVSKPLDSISIGEI